ncbi:hypothetical protein L9F63_001353, partial [Diploptera punctata]
RRCNICNCLFRKNFIEIKNNLFGKVLLRNEKRSYTVHLLIFNVNFGKCKLECEVFNKERFSGKSVVSEDWCLKLNVLRAILLSCLQVSYKRYVALNNMCYI